MGDLQALGDAITGGVLGRAVEPVAGEVPDGHSHEHSCLNCGAALAGPFCHDCGQHAHVHRTLAAFFHDFLHGVLHFEGKIWRTLPLLAWKPGDLTRRYIDGQRARFVSPLALFLFMVFLMFAIIHSLGGSAESFKDPSGVYHSTDEAIAGTKSDILRLQAKKAKADAEDIGDIDTEIAAQTKALSMLQKFKNEGVTNAILSDGGKNGLNVNSSIPWLNAQLQKAKANPQLMIYKVQSASYKFSWLLIPISIPFLWLLFPFSRRFKPYDHAVFVTYSLAFMTLLVATLSIIGWLGWGVLAGLLTLYIPFHMYRQLKGGYALSRSSALWRTAILLLFAAVALLLFICAVVALGVSD